MHEEAVGGGGGGWLAGAGVGGGATPRCPENTIYTYIRKSTYLLEAVWLLLLLVAVAVVVVVGQVYFFFGGGQSINTRAACEKRAARERAGSRKRGLITCAHMIQMPVLSAAFSSQTLIKQVLRSLWLNHFP